jgi:inhibitor of KinA
MSQQLTYQQFGELGILVSWGDKICHEVSHDIALFNKKIHKVLSEKIIETVTAYCSLTVYLEQGVDQNEIIATLKKIYQSEGKTDEIKPRIWDIPVCYDQTFGIDLEKLAKQKSLSVEKLINEHSQALYTVDFLGFLPGFPYLSGLNPLLFTKRLKTPRLSVAKGSVAIGGNQTGIYPISSPGGWHIIGRTSVDFFNVNNDSVCFIKPMDKIKFRSISLKEFHNG